MHLVPFEYLVLWFNQIGKLVAWVSRKFYATLPIWRPAGSVFNQNKTFERSLAQSVCSVFTQHFTVSFNSESFIFWMTLSNCFTEITQKDWKYEYCLLNLHGTFYYKMWCLVNSLWPCFSFKVDMYTNYVDKYFTFFHPLP